MNVGCSAIPCPVILDCSCVHYSGANLIYTGINTNDTLCLALEKIDNKFRDAGLGYVFQNGITQAAPGQPVKLGGALIEPTTIANFGYPLTVSNILNAGAHVTIGGTASDFVKGDGSLDNTTYQPAGNYITDLTGDGTATGPGSAAFTLTTTGVIPNTYGSATQIPIITVDTKGRVTWATTTALTIPPATMIYSGDVSGIGQTNSTIPLTLNTVLSTPGTYGSGTTVPVFTVNGKGLITGITQVPFSTGGGGTVTSVGVVSSTGIAATVANPTTTPVITILNTAPDRIVAITGGAGINVTGTYPSFTVTNTGLLTVPNLQQVTDVGNITTKDIYVNSVYYYDPAGNGYGQIDFNDHSFLFHDGDGVIRTAIGEGAMALRNLTSGFQWSLNSDNITSDKFFQIPNYSGSITPGRTLVISVNGVLADTTGNITIPTGGVTAVTASSPLASSGGTTPNITIQQASGSQNGYLSSGDWTTFNGKQNTITLTTTGSSGPATFIANTLNIPQYSGGTSTGVNGLNGTTNIGLGGTLDATTYIDGTQDLFWGFSTPLNVEYHRANEIYLLSSGQLAKIYLTDAGPGSGQITIQQDNTSSDTSLYKPLAVTTTGVVARMNDWPGLTGTGTATQVAFWDTSSSISGNNDLWWDNVNNRLGVGISTPQVRLHVGNGGGSMGFPYEEAIVEKTGDTKFGVYTSTSSPFSGGASYVLGYTNFLTNDGYYPGFEFQHVGNAVDNDNKVRFNFLQRNSAGVVIGNSIDLLDIYASGRVVLNPTSPALAPVPQFLLGLNTSAYAVDIQSTLSSRISSLGGGGTLMVVTDNDGVLSTQAIPGGGGGITSLNGLSGATQTFTDDTNVTIVSSGTAHAITWAGTLADSRIASASTWNAKFTLPSLTSGSVLFSNGTTIAQDNTNFFWDDTNNRLGIGTNSPSYGLDVRSGGRFTDTVILQNSTNGGLLTLYNSTNSFTGSINATASLPQIGNSIAFLYNNASRIAYNDDYLSMVHKSTGNDVIKLNSGTLSAGSTSGNIIDVTQYGTWNPSTGTNNLNIISLSPSITSTGGTNTVRGVLYNPNVSGTLTNIAFENTIGENRFNSTSGVTKFGSYLQLEWQPTGYTGYGRMYAQQPLVIGGNANYSDATKPYLTIGVLGGNNMVASSILIRNAFGDVSQTSGTVINTQISGRIGSASGNPTHTYLNIIPQYDGNPVGNTYTGTIRGVYYNPLYSTAFPVGATNIAWENTTGDIIHGNLAGGGTQMVTVDNTGKLGTTTVPTGTVGGTGTTNYISKWTGTSTLGNSNIFDNGTAVNTSTPFYAGLTDNTANYIKLDNTSVGTSPFIEFLYKNAVYRRISFINDSTSLNVTNGFLFSSDGTLANAQQIIVSDVMAKNNIDVQGGVLKVIGTGDNYIRMYQRGIAERGTMGYASGSGTFQIRVNGATNLSTGTQGLAIESTGAVTLPNLATGGTAQMVTADSNGKLGIQTIPSGGSSPLTTKGDIYTYSTVDARLPVGLDTQVLLADSSTTTGLKWGSNTTPTPTGYYGQYFSYVTQSATTNNVGKVMAFETPDIYSGVTVVTDGTALSRITFANTGKYNLQFSTQFQNTANAQHDVYIWIRKNGVDVAGSTGLVSIPARKSAGAGNEGHVIVSWNFLLDIVGGDYYQIVWATSDVTNVTIQYYAGNPPPPVTTTNYPSTASTLFTVTQLSGIMAGTGISRGVYSVSTNTAAGSGANVDYVYLVSGTTTVTLPTAVGNTNRYTIKNTGTNVVSIATTSSQTIDGSTAPITINTPNVSLDLISDGSNWYII